jgi:hypothetical protein
MRRENLTTLSQPVPWDDKQQYATGFQPAIGVAQERLFSAATVSRPECPIIWRIQIQEAKALDRALHFQRISLNDVGDPLPGLLRTEGIELDTVAKHLSTVGDNLERHAIANTGVNGGRRGIWKAKESTNSLGFG